MSVSSFASSSSSRARASASRRSSPSGMDGTSMFSRSVISLKTRAIWKVRPMPRRATASSALLVMAAPLNRMVPLLAV